MRPLVSLFALVSSAALASEAAAQTPAPKTIRIIVPFTAGASNDAIARALAESPREAPAGAVAIS